MLTAGSLNINSEKAGCLNKSYTDGNLPSPAGRLKNNHRLILFYCHPVPLSANRLRAIFYHLTRINRNFLKWLDKYLINYGQALPA
jgi:hypothetical protein